MVLVSNVLFWCLVRFYNGDNINENIFFPFSFFLFGHYANAHIHRAVSSCASLHVWNCIYCCNIFALVQTAVISIKQASARRTDLFTIMVRVHHSQIFFFFLYYIVHIFYFHEMYVFMWVSKNFSEMENWFWLFLPVLTWCLQIHSEVDINHGICLFFYNYKMHRTWKLGKTFMGNVSINKI